MHMHAASGLCTQGVSNVGGVTAGPSRHNSIDDGGVTAGQVGHGPVVKLPKSRPGNVEYFKLV